MASGPIARLVADLLATNPDDRVLRAALRHRLPEGRVRPRPRGSSTQNDVGERFRDALREFERAGWIERDRESIVILDRGPLWEYANG